MDENLARGENMGLKTGQFNEAEQNIGRFLDRANEEDDVYIHADTVEQSEG